MIVKESAKRGRPRLHKEDKEEEVLVPGLRPAQRVVLLAKHLCGLATDISLRSAATFTVPPSSTSSSSAAGPSTERALGEGGSREGGVLSSQLGGVAIATCCHHACSWEDYVGATFLKTEGGVTAAEFEVLRQWSG